MVSREVVAQTKSNPWLHKLLVRESVPSTRSNDAPPNPVFLGGIEGGVSEALQVPPCDSIGYKAVLGLHSSP